MAEGHERAQGYRGYISSRPVDGVAYPHKIQNLVVRDYCQRKNMLFYLSATEGSMPGSFMMLHDLLSHLDKVKGIVLFSQFVLPAERKVRDGIYRRILEAGRELHAALEQAVITAATDVEDFDMPLKIAPWLALTPFGGHFPVVHEGGEKSCFDINQWPH
jgi:sporadic carbohydrate cluster protein (TIGR04323 family)